MIHLTKIIAALLMLVALALGIYAWVLSRKPAPLQPTAIAAAAASKEQKALFPVVVTTRAVPAGQPLTAESLRVERLPINPSGAFQEVAKAVDGIPVADMGEGTPVLANQLVTGLALHVAAGERALAVKADEMMGVGNRVRPGDFVDVFFTLKTDSKEIERSQARLLLSRMRVLAYGSASVDGSPSQMTEGKAAQSQQRAEAARTVVLAVPVADVNRLALGEATGRLVLALRHPTDLSEPDRSLFAELPTAMQPQPLKAGAPARGPLESIDRAQAGLTAIDLATGGTPTQTRSNITPVRSAPPSTSRAAATARGPRGAEVEFIRGDKRETLSY
ncbi:Flp pilus assembly protein CpaB [Variovorax sp. UMC13]|uniref:Flp pilus assembly protein CpaB n=1 Tax=Variovorax sp. UMC13 TaxID=1862326 RepID=UPI0015FF0552|nr:Flp pilus assembly protein CpaB [Variovorax sp. UMC13]MBB1599330.1 Flp pilus assembly protein CpaB [Variovorax sp. UMC13]